MGLLTLKVIPASTDCLSVFHHFVGLALKGLNFNAESKVTRLHLFNIDIILTKVAALLQT